MCRKGVIGSTGTSRAILASRDMKLVAQVSSSTSSASVPASSASMMLAAWLVDPLASSVLKLVVSRPCGRLLMKGEMSRPVTGLPSSARTLTAVSSVTTNSRPSPGTWL